jgi:hypothetical protein
MLADLRGDAVDAFAEPFFTDESLHGLPRNRVRKTHCRASAREGKATVGPLPTGTKALAP